MPNDKPQSDNLTQLSRRQARVADKLYRAISNPDGMSDEDWITFLNVDLTDTIMVPMSPGFRRSLQDLTGNGGYKIPDNLYRLYWMMFDEFAHSRNEYVRRGLLTTEPVVPEIGNTMTNPLPAEDVLGDLLEEE